MDMDALAVRVRQERERRGWTQEDLSERTGGQVKVGAISNFEGRRSYRLQPSNLRAVLRALELEDEAGDARAAETRSTWPSDIQFFLDLVGMFLEAQPEERRAQIIRDVTRKIVSMR